MKKGEKHNIVAGLLQFALPIDTVHLDPNNAVTHGAESVEAIKRSLEAFGQDQPIVIQKKGMIVRKGNGRLLAAAQLGWTHIAGIVVDEADVDAIARAIADNRSADFRTWNYGALSTLFKQIDQAKPELTFATSFTLKEIVQREVAARPAAAGLADPDAVPEPPKVPITRPGDLWIIGGYVARCPNCDQVTAVEGD